MATQQDQDDKLLEALVAEIERRLGYREFAPFLAQHGLGKAQGWDKFLGKLKDAGPDLKRQALIALKDLHSALVVAGTKDVFIFELSDEDVEALAAEVEDVEPSESPYSRCFPFSLDQAALAQQSRDHVLAERIIYESGDVSFVLAAKRTFEERDKYSLDEVNQAVRDAFVGFDEFIAVKRSNYQIFDVVTIRPHLRRLEVLIDEPDRAFGTEDSNARCQMVLGRLSTLIPSLGPIYERDTPIDLAPCIGSMYHRRTEGRVTRLSFRSPSGSVNKGLVPTQTDLRTDDFHEYGVQGVGQIAPYDVTIAWDNLAGERGTVAGRIGMPLSGLSGEGHFVRSARLTDARSDGQVVAVLNKFVSYSTG